MFKEIEDTNDYADLLFYCESCSSEVAVLVAVWRYRYEISLADYRIKFAVCVQA
jgi:hypothetical protein